MFADRRRLLIGGVAVIVLGLAAWTLMPAAPAAVAPGSTRSPRPRGAAPAAAPATAEPMQPLKLELLAASAGREQPGDADRNPFRFKPKPPPPPPPRPVVTDPKPDVRPMPTVPAGPPPAPPIPFKFIGILTRENGEKWAVLTDGRVTVHGRDGDIIDGRYKILKIGLESIELSYADGRGRQTVRLTGQ